MKKWSMFQIAFLAFCAAMNLALGAIISMFKLPFFLDSIGTFIAAALGGWFYGAATGLLSVIVAAVVITPTAPAYAGTAIIIALCVGILVRYRFLSSLFITIIGGIFIGIVSAIISAPVTTYLYGGVSLSGADAVTAFFRAIGKTLMESVILGGLATDPADKLATSLISFMLIKSMPRSIFRKFKNGKLFLSSN